MPQYLLILRTKSGARAKLVDSYESAKEAAVAFVGDHNPVDGCSSVPQTVGKLKAHGHYLDISRSTSFGVRSASVRPIGTDFEVEL